jgi:glutamate-1-semialdehyde 2,1-aminomutase
MPLERKRSREALEVGRRAVAGGDSSNMRVLPYHPPMVAESGEGCRILDIDGNEYVDMNMAYGPLLFGHRPRFVLERVIREISESGSMLGFPHLLSHRVAQKLQRAFPSMDLIRFANSGTEAVATTIRLARAVTGRRKLILFEGHYHGWSDTVFHKYHASAEELSARASWDAIPGTAGMNGAPCDVLVVPWNDATRLGEIIERHRGDVAAVVMEPIMANAGVIPPEPGYLPAVREIADAAGALLVFDEVITGLRVARGGAQELYGVRPDLTVLSKALGAGFPVAALGGRRDLMQSIVDRDVFHGGVYSGNSAVLAATEAVLDRVLEHGDTMYPALRQAATQFASDLREVLSRNGVPHTIQFVGPLIGLFLTRDGSEPIRTYRDARARCDMERYIALQHDLLDRNVYIHPNQFEPMYLSTEHSDAHLARVLSAFDDVTAS